MEKINKYPTDTTVVPDSLDRNRQTSSAESEGEDERQGVSRERERERGWAGCPLFPVTLSLFPATLKGHTV